MFAYSTTLLNTDGPAADGKTWEIRELSPEDDGKSHSYTKGAITPYGDTVDELRDELLYMLAALKKPILDLTTDTPQLRPLDADVAA